jgi:hypothetical protein
LTALLVGEPNLSTIAGGYVSTTPGSWTYAAYPATFPSPIVFNNNMVAPNIYVQP